MTADRPEDFGFAPATDAPIAYIPRLRAYYRGLGYGAPYKWAHYAEVPFTPLQKPLSECRVALVTTAAPYQPCKGDQGPGAPYNAAAKFYEVYSGDSARDHDLRIAHVAIDRARFKRTVIGKGTKVDNLVHIAHNVEVGANCILVAQVGIAGSTRIGNNVIIAGQAGIDGHVEIGDNVKVAGKAGVTRNIEPGSVVWGFPARSRSRQLREKAFIAKLPDAFTMLKELKERLERIEKKSENH